MVPKVFEPLKFYCIWIFAYFLYFPGGQSISQEALKQRLKLKATRTASRGKQENAFSVKEEGKQFYTVIALMFLGQKYVFKR